VCVLLLVDIKKQCQRRCVLLTRVIVSRSKLIADDIASSLLVQCIVITFVQNLYYFFLNTVHIVYKRKLCSYCFI